MCILNSFLQQIHFKLRHRKFPQASVRWLTNACRHLNPHLFLLVSCVEFLTGRQCVFHPAVAGRGPCSQPKVSQELPWAVSYLQNPSSCIQQSQFKTCSQISIGFLKYALRKNVQYLWKSRLWVNPS